MWLMASLNLFQASSKLDAIRKNLTPIGNFTATQHKVEGMVWALNDSIIIIENFVYDGKGFGVFMHVGKSLMTSLSLPVTLLKRTIAQAGQINVCW